MALDRKPVATSRLETPSLLPHLHRYFWDYGGRVPSLEKDRHTVVKRLLEVGGWDAVTWLRENVDDAELRQLILTRRGRGMSPKRLRFWGLILRLPRSEVDAWIASRKDDPWHARTRA